MAPALGPIGAFCLQAFGVALLEVSLAMGRFESTKKFLNSGSKVLRVWNAFNYVAAMVVVAAVGQGISSLALGALCYVVVDARGAKAHHAPARRTCGGVAAVVASVALCCMSSYLLWRKARERFVTTATLEAMDVELPQMTTAQSSATLAAVREVAAALPRASSAGTMAAALDAEPALQGIAPQEQVLWEQIKKYFRKIDEIDIKDGKITSEQMLAAVQKLLSRAGADPRSAAAAAARLVDAADRHDGVIDGNIELDGFGQAVIDVVARHNVSREVLGILIGEDEEEPLLTKPYRRASASSLAAGALAPEEYRSPDRAPKPVAAAAEAPQLVIAAIPAFRPQADRSHDDWASHLLFETIQSRCGGLMNTKLVVTVLVGASLDTLALACLLLGGAATFGPLVCGLVLACVAVTCMSNVPSLRPLRFIFNYVLRDDRMLFAASAATLAAGLLGDQ
ncbi:hypothetical protein M885DRAFT_532325 [Pelagophyceae sp. CCMP2097]|nr:hypothetical protein M885DRAFT_532325 [Pelagophyceae sp. CCMP2097]